MITARRHCPTEIGCSSPSSTSIENYLCTRSAVNVVLDVVVGLTNDSAAKTALLEKFEESLSAFQCAMLPVFAWSVASRLKGAKLVLGNVGPNLDSCFEIDDFRPREKCDLVEHFRGTCCADAGLSANEHEIAHWVGVLGTTEPKVWLRGKYELWFTLRFLNEVWEGLVGELITDRRKIKKGFNLHQDNVFSVCWETKSLRRLGLLGVSGEGHRCLGSMLLVVYQCFSRTALEQDRFLIAHTRQVCRTLLRNGSLVSVAFDSGGVIGHSYRAPDYSR